jgi:hypothetical protein
LASSLPLVLAWFVAMAGTALAAASPPGGALERIEAAATRGSLTFSEAARQKLLYLFDRDHLAPEFRAEGEGPAKCGTVVVAELTRQRDRLDADARALLDGFVRAEAVAAPPPETYVTPHFRVSYETSGPDAPVQDDVAPANGVPDFVEATAAACEQAWAVEVGELGYTAPAVPNGAQARYPVTYQAQSAYGYTVVLSGQLTQIVLHPSYAGFPPNDDADGDALGALRVTVAHELKHAIQRMYTSWNEGPWLELDATWAEEMVFDPINDYYHFIRLPGSPFTEPQASLLLGGGGAYEDCNWQLYQTERFGTGFMLAFWERRRRVQVEPVMTTYAQTLLEAGASLDSAWGEYVAWNFASGERAQPGFGYQESTAYPTAPASFVHEALPVPSTAWSVAGLAASIHLIPNPDATLGGTPEFTFAGAPAIAWQVSVLARTRSGPIVRVPMPVANGAASLQLAGLDWSELEWAALVVGNPTEAPVAVSYAFSARAVAPILIAHEPAWSSPEGPAPVVIRARVMAGTSTPTPGSATLHYRVNGGTIVALPMAATGSPDEHAAAIPAQPAGATVEYRVTAIATDGSPASSPSLAGAFHGFQVVQVFEPFEVEGGWTVGDAGDGATSGVWERAVPLGTVAAPFRDATSPPGAACFVTERGSPGQPAGAADVDGGRTSLLSPVFAFYTGRPYASATARYRRWYSNHVGGRADDTWRVEASNDAGVTWTVVETATQGEDAWIPVEVDLLALFGGPAQLRFRFVAEDAGTPSLVEGALDDFEIVALLEDAVAIGDGVVPRVELGHVVPNPGQDNFKIRMALPGSSRVDIEVRDVQGRLVRRLAGAWFSAGVTWVAWDGRTEDGRVAAPGLYLVQARVDGERCTRRLAKLR